MKSFNLKIAGYIIRFEAPEEGPSIAPSARFLRNISDETACDVQITVHRGITTVPGEAERVFHAPFVEEIDNVQIHHKTNFWSVWKDDTQLYIMTICPLSSTAKNAILKFSLTEKKWELWIESSSDEIDPFEYPLDGLILYYLTVINKDIMIHASGVTYKGNGYIFSGVSGKGKSTIARLWEEHGARVIHDDRLIIRKTENGYSMYNTPVYNDDDPQEAPLNKIFLLEHSIENKCTEQKEGSAVSLVMANCIQHAWGSEIISQLLEAVSEMSRTIPVYRLFFRPESSVIDLILKIEEKDGET